MSRLDGVINPEEPEAPEPEMPAGEPVRLGRP